MSIIFGSAIFQIDGKSLDMQMTPDTVFKLDNRFFPKTDRADHVQYQVLENNDVAIVAAKSTALNFPSPLGPIIGAAIITINKSNGELNIGSVDAALYGQRMAGVCKLNSAAP